MNPVDVLNIKGEWQSFSPGLERIKAVLDALGNPHKNYRHYLVGGTNGKGTVTFNLSHSLPGRVGRVTSPHLVDVRERITVDGNWLPDELWQRAEAKILAASDIELSYFEWLTALSVVMFDMVGVDAAVFEIGLGGRLDAFNALDPELSVLTNVSLDHTEMLGDTVEEIALEKIEIARPGRPFILSDVVFHFPGIKRRLQEIGAEAICFQVKEGINGNLQPLNTALDCLGLPQKSKLAMLPGRRQFFRKDPPLILDAAHNEAAWHDLVNWLKQENLTNLHLLCGLTKGRDPHRFLEIMDPVCSRVAFCPMGHEREIEPSLWPKSVERLDPTQIGAFLAVPSLISGSLYMVGYCLNLLR